MGLKTIIKKHDESIRELDPTWAWLRTYPAYKKDFQKFRKSRAYADYQKTFRIPKDEWGFKERWGFFPLTPPENDDPGFLVDAYKLFGKHPWHLAVDCMTEGYPMKLADGSLLWPGGKMKSGLPKAPKRIVLSIDFRHPKNVLLDEVKRHIEHFQALYSAEMATKDVCRDFQLQYMNFVLGTQGQPYAARKKILYAYAGKPHLPEEKAAQRKRIGRILNFKQPRPV